MPKFILLSLLTIIFISGCAKGTIQPAPDIPAVPKEEIRLSAEEQQKMAEKIFTEILDLTLTTHDRKEIFHDVEKLYLEMLNNYPDAHLANEGYIRLIKLYLEVPIPGNIAKAEKIYQDYSLKYPTSSFRDRIRKTIDTKRAELGAPPR